MQLLMFPADGKFRILTEMDQDVLSLLACGAHCCKKGKREMESSP